MNEETSLKKMETIHEYICNECQSGISYPMRLNEKIFQRIKNAADILYHNACKSVWQHKPVKQDNFPELTMDTTNEILLLIYKAIMSPDFPVNIEARIKHAIAQYNIDPEQLLFLYAWQVESLEALRRDC